MQSQIKTLLSQVHHHVKMRTPLYLDYRREIIRSLIAKVLFLLILFLSSGAYTCLLQGLSTLIMSSLGMPPLVKKLRSKALSKRQEAFQLVRLLSNLAGVFYGLYELFIF